MRIVSVADIAGDGAAHTLSSLLGAAAGESAKWIQWIAPSANTGTVRIGDSSITTGQGLPIPAGGAMFYPPIAEVAERYTFSNCNYLIPVGSTLSVTYAV